MPPNAFGEQNSVPSGMIVIWAGLLADIPSGWVICDGMNGTPNLLGQFVKSTTDGSDMGATGGTDSLTLSTSQLPGHSHGGNTSNTGAHKHYFSDAVNQDMMNAYSTKSTVRDFDNSNSTQFNSYNSGSHSHNISTNSTGSGSSIENRPPYYEVAYIMKT